jgi:hypothetical protein
MSLKFPEKYELKGSVFGMKNFRIPYKGQFIYCVASIDAAVWEHVSVTIRYPKRRSKRCPTWDEMCFVKNIFWDEEDEVIQFHPKKSQYANLHSFCLHLWRPVNGNLNLPEFYAF